MKGNKTAVANFNVVFMNKEKEEPLLNYFDTVVMPALTSGITKKSGDSTFLLMDIELRVDANGEYVLTGVIVKSTTLEVKSMFDVNGKLVKRDDVYPTAPFSTFVIYLKNHRMILVENQKGSPSIDSFRSTVKYILDIYVARSNISLKESGEKLLPIPLVNVVGIPPRGGIANTLKHVEKIKKLTLRFYPLNGDGEINLSGVLGGISKELRRHVGSDGGEVSFPSPKNINGVIDVLEQAEGTVEPIIVVKYPKGRGESTIKNDTASDRRRMTVVGENSEEELQNIIKQGKEIDSINYISKENNSIYERNKDKIIQFVRK